jgi:tetratricopeptide (TPR) repeat protein
MKIMMLLFLAITFIDAREIVINNCDDSYKEIWQLYSGSTNEEALRKRLEACTFSDPIAIDSMNVLKAVVFYNENKYKETLKSLELSRKQIEQYYALRNTKLPEGHSKSDVDFLYYAMVSLTANTYYVLGEYQKALQYYKQWIDSANANSYLLDPEILEPTAYSYYLLKEYDSALLYLKKAYQLSKDFKKRMQFAYNVSALYARLKDNESSIKWLKIPMDVNRSLYLEKVYKDDDFYSIRQTTAFKKAFGIQENNSTIQEK